MNISLTSELEEFVSKKVNSGLYQTASEVVREGLRLLRERDEISQRKLESLRQEINLGIAEADQGKVTQFDEKTLDRIKTRVRNRRKHNGTEKT